MDNSSRPLTYSEYQKLVRKCVIENRLGKTIIRDIGISLGIGLVNGLVVYYFTKGMSDILSPLVLVISTFFVYGVIYLIYFKIERVSIYNEQKEKIEKLSPANPDIAFVFPPLQGKGKQKLEVINKSSKEIVCHAVLTFIAPVVFDTFRAYPSWWHSKNLVWGSGKISNGNATIDSNGGKAILDIAELLDDKFNFLFQNGDTIQVGFDWEDEYKKNWGLPPNAYLVNLRLDGSSGKKNLKLRKNILFYSRLKN
ncbi:MAG: hypothetical protein JNJ43_11440 [Anaerolineales bacterium]|nr:hypothetical protein [Anaerolineales bacterium]